MDDHPGPAQGPASLVAGHLRQLGVRVNTYKVRVHRSKGGAIAEYKVVAPSRATAIRHAETRARDRLKLGASVQVTGRIVAVSQ